MYLGVKIIATCSVNCIVYVICIYTHSLPVGVLMQGLDQVLVGPEQREEMRLQRQRKREKQW